MSFWYDIKHEKYASDGKYSWIRVYAEKLVEALRCEVNAKFSAHFTGKANRHKAADVDCADGKTVQTALETEAQARAAADNLLQSSINAETAARIEAVNKVEKITDNDINGFIPERGSGKARIGQTPTQLIIAVDHSSNGSFDSTGMPILGVTTYYQYSILLDGAVRLRKYLSNQWLDWVKVNEAELALKADKSYVDTKLAQKANSADVYSKTQTDSAIEAAIDEYDAEAMELLGGDTE